MKKFLLLLLVIFTQQSAADTPVRIGVLSHRGYEVTVRDWSPTADYLSGNIPGYRFEIVPLDFEEVDPAVQFGEVDFLLVDFYI